MYIYIFIYIVSLKVHVYYDDSFFNQFGPTTSSVFTRIKAVLSMVKTIYSHRASLTTVIVPKVTKIEHKPGRRWKATENDLR